MNTQLFFRPHVSRAAAILIGGVMLSAGCDSNSGSAPGPMTPADRSVTTPTNEVGQGGLPPTAK